MTRTFMARISDRFRREPYANDVVALHEFRALYFPIPKVACSSLLSLCVDLLRVRLPEDAWKPELFHTTRFDHLIRKDAVVIRKEHLGRHAAYWSFAFVRNPWDRLVSCYAEKIRDDGNPENFVGGVSKVLLPYGVFRRGMSFEAFARAVAEIPEAEAEPHFRSQHTFITDRKGRRLVTFVGRFEALQDDFAYVCRRIGVSAPLPHLLRSRRGPCRDYYTRELAELVARRYQADIELFQYRFDWTPDGDVHWSGPPAQKAGSSPAGTRRLEP